MSLPLLLASVTTTTTTTEEATEPVFSQDCGTVCSYLTENERFSESTAKLVGAVLDPALEILVIVVLLVVARALLRRIVGTVVKEMKEPVGATAFHRLADKVDGGHDVDPISTERRARRAESMGALLRSIGTAVIWTLALLMILGAFGLNLAPLIAGAGIVGVALGFGAQDLVKDFLSGVFMLVEDQYGVGDTVDVGEAAGIVEGISLRTTRIRDVQGRLWHVPNGEIRRVANSSQAWARALLDVDIAYGADIDDAIRVIQAAGEQMAAEEKWDQLFLEAPEVWGVQNLASDSIQLRIVIKTVAGEQFGVGRELRRRIKYALDEADIEIPFQQRTIWLRTDDEAVAVAKKATQKRAAARKKSTTAKKSTAKKATAKKATAKRATSAKSKAKQAVQQAATEGDEPEVGGARQEV